MTTKMKWIRKMRRKNNGGIWWKDFAKLTRCAHRICKGRCTNARQQRASFFCDSLLHFIFRFAFRLLSIQRPEHSSACLLSQAPLHCRQMYKYSEQILVTATTWYHSVNWELNSLYIPVPVRFVFIAFLFAVSVSVFLLARCSSSFYDSQIPYSCLLFPFVRFYLTAP